MSKVAKFNAFEDEKPREECGVFGIYRNDDEIDSVVEVCSGLYSLQHRGQLSAGICVNDNGNFKCLKNSGVISEAFRSNALEELPNGKIAVGHVKHSVRKFEETELISGQPLLMRYKYGSLAIAHNGDITNKAKLYEELQESGSIFQSNSNAELISYIIAGERIEADSIEEAVLRTMDKLEGAYSMVIVSPSKLIAVRDPHGFRPLCLGKMKNSYMVSSESCAFDSLGAEFVRDIKPGEVLVIDESGVHSYTEHCGGRTSMCIFEQIYVARPDSVLDNQSVHLFRMNVGKVLAEKYPVEADIVCGIPDSGVSCAIGYAAASGIPYGIAIIKNKYLGRTLSMDSDSMRKRTLEIKINVLKPTVCGKRVVIIDDSIVRGGTMSHIVELLKKAGAREVHVRVASPPFKNSCYYGTSLPEREKLISNRMTADELREKMGADSLEYISVEDLIGCADSSDVDFCCACFSGDYPIGKPEEEFFDKYSRKIQR